MAARLPQCGAIRQKTHVSKQVVFLQCTFIQTQHHGVNALSTQQSSRIQTLNNAVIDQHVGSRKTQVEAVCGGSAKGMADGTRDNAIIRSAIPHEEHTRRVLFDMMQLIHCPPNREDGSIALHDGFTV